MKRLAITLLIILTLTIGCINVLGEHCPHSNHLYLTAKEMPAGTEFIFYVDIGKLAGAKEVVKQMGVPPEAAALGLLIKSVRMGGKESGASTGTIIIETVVSPDIFISTILERMAPEGADVEVTKKEYKGMTLYSVGGEQAYLAQGAKIYLGDTESLEGVIEVKKGAPSAVTEFDPILKLLPEGAVLAAYKTQKKDVGSPRMAGASAVIKGKNAIATMIGIFDTVQEAEAGAATIKPEDGITIESIDIQGTTVITKITVDLEKKVLTDSMGMSGKV